MKLVILVSVYMLLWQNYDYKNWGICLWLFIINYDVMGMGGGKCESK